MWAKRREVVADPAACLQRQASFMNLTENIVHGILDRTRDRAVDSRGGGLMLECTRIGGNASRWNRALFERPDKLLVPMLAFAVTTLDFSQCARHPFKGIVDRVINTIAILGLEAVLLVPYVQRRLLQGQTSRACFASASSRASTSTVLI